MSGKLFAAAALFAAALAFGCSSAGDSTKFMKDAAQGGLSEVALGKMAVQKGTSPAVKSFGQMMVDDHTRANNELAQVASRKGVTLPTDVSAKQNAMADKLSKLSGAEFDKEYAKEMVSDHQEDVEEFQKQAQNGTDPDVKAFAEKTLPVLQKHLAAAKQLPQ